jgi:thiol-disulfide isomerase/thioredoxin
MRAFSEERLPMLANLALSAFLAVSSPVAEGPFQELGFDQALAAAKKDGKVVMIDFFTTWCGPCKRLDKVTWADADVQKWLGEKTVALKIDAEKEAKLADRFDVHAYPTIVFVKADGTKIDAIVGFKPPPEFLELAKGLLGGKSPVPAAKDPQAGSDGDPAKRHAHAVELARAGQNEEALAEYLWCFDHGQESIAFAGIRLAILPGEIKALGRDYPAAIKALEERRDKAEAAVLAGTAAEQNAADMAALNRELGTRERNLAVYDRLKKENRLDPAVKLRLVRDVAPLLVDARRYAELVADAGDIEERVRQEIDGVRSTPPPPAPPDEASAKALARSQAMYASKRASDLGLWYEALLGTGQTNAAGKVLDRILAFAPTGTAYAALVDRALHAENPDAARAIVERGRASLTGNEKAIVEAAARKLPASK